MFYVYIDNKPLHNIKLKEDGLVIYNSTLTFELGKAGSFKFTITPDNPRYNDYTKLVSFVTVYDNDEEIFRGRVLDDEEDFYKRKAVIVEGDLNFLIDSIYRPFEFTGDIPDFINALVSNHNSQVEEAKQFNIGDITITDANNYINRSSVYYNDTLTTINEKIIETHGGYVDTRKGDDGLYYLDFLEDYTNINAQVIQFKENLLDISKYITAENIYTALIPIGAEVEEESKDEDGETVTTTSKIDITSVNDGLDYIYSETGVNLFGWIWKSEEWEDVTEPSNLLTKAKAKLESNISLDVTLTITAFDLHLLNVDTERFKKGDYVRIISLPHNIDEYFQLNKITLDFDHPDQSVYEFGVSYNTLSAVTASRNKSVTQATETANSASASASETLNQVNNIVTNLDSDYVATSTFNAFRQTLGTASTANTANYLTVQTSGYVLDARQGYTLSQMINNVSDDIPSKLSEMENDDDYAKLDDIPTKTSQLENDSGFITEQISLEGYAKTDDIPTRLSQLENDQGYLTEHQSLEGYVDLETFESKISDLEARLSALEGTNEEEQTEE